MTGCMPGIRLPVPSSLDPLAVATTAPPWVQTPWVPQSAMVVCLTMVSLVFLSIRCSST